MNPTTTSVFFSLSILLAATPDLLQIRYTSSYIFGTSEAQPLLLLRVHIMQAKRRWGYSPKYQYIAECITVPSLKYWKVGGMMDKLSSTSASRGHQISSNLAIIGSLSAAGSVMGGAGCIHCGSRSSQREMQCEGEK